MSTLGWLFLIAGLFIGGFAFFVLAGILRERHEDRQAAWEFRRTGTPRTFRVDLPCMEAGSWHRAAPRVIRSGPQYPLDVAVPVQPPVLTATRPAPDRAAAGTRPGGGLADVQPVLAERHPPATPNVPGLGGSSGAEAPALHRTGDDSLPGTGTPDGRSRSLAGDDVIPPRPPDWVQPFLYGDLIAAITRDKQHCAALASAA